MSFWQPYLVYILPIFVFFSVLSVSFILRLFLYRKLERWSSGTKTPWDNIVIQASRTPLVILILIVSVWVTKYFVSIPENIDHTLSDVIRLLVILAALFFMDQFFTLWVEQHASHHKVLFSSKRFISTLVHVVILIFVVLFILNALGISITPFLASLGIGSLAVALALQDTLKNVFAGVYLLMDRPISKGDLISLEDGQQGFVEAIGWRSTRLKLFSEDILIIPNSNLASSMITNHELPSEVSSLKITCGVHYDSDLEKVEKVVLEEANSIQVEHPAGLESYKPVFGFYEFSELSVLFFVRLGVKHHADQATLKSEFIKKLHQRFACEGIVIPFTGRTVQLTKSD
ncbi:MAG: mechanosensitive ion channel family protein [Deltaproteobacteria bacterium]|nr:mechanosensitive ion channel family protein [Deltaproteobacteria bacterium]